MQEESQTVLHRSFRAQQKLLFLQVLHEHRVTAKVKNTKEALCQLLSDGYLTDADGVVQHSFGVSGVVAARQLGVAEVGLQQQVGLGVCAIIGVGVDLQGELLSQLAVQLVLVVSDGQLGILLCILKEIKSETRSAKHAVVTPFKSEHVC